MAVGRWHRLDRLGLPAVRYFTAEQYGQEHRVANDPSLAVCGRPVPADAKMREVAKPPKGECPRCADTNLPDYTTKREG